MYTISSSVVALQYTAAAARTSSGDLPRDISVLCICRTLVYVFVALGRPISTARSWQETWPQNRRENKSGRDS